MSTQRKIFEEIMHTLIKPKSRQALKEVLEYQEELVKHGCVELSLLPEARIDALQTRILTWNSRERERLIPPFQVDLVLPGVDTRLRTLHVQSRPYDVLRVVTPLDVSLENGFDEAVKVFQSLSPMDWHWYIIGEPADESYFEKLTDAFDSWGWEDNVSFLGNLPIEERIKLYMNMDVGFYPAKDSPLSPGLLEMAQLGLPIASRSIGFAKDLLVGDDDGLLFDKGEEVLAFFQRYSGREETVRRKRDHPLLKRKWSQAASEVRALSAETPSD
ncbi:MAG: glycosyltransferase family 1 protein [Proteobacteria bacterium]|nr:MAG: glycosyltransferase family 1 protein [Pseudomonadota bacterium]